MLLGVNSILNQVVTATDMLNKASNTFNNAGINADMINQRIDEVFKAKRVLVDATDPVDRIKDSSWVHHGILSEAIKYSDGDNVIRFYSLADIKFEDASLGGNFVINPRPQFTRYADTRSTGILRDNKEVTISDGLSKIGMGLYYAEAIDSTHQTIHMRFGLPMFNSLIGFVRNFFNAPLARVVTVGRGSDALNDILFKAAQAVVFINTLGLQAISFVINGVMNFVSFALNKPFSKYYTMKPTMVIYWMVVNNIANTIAAYKGWYQFSSDYNQKLKTQGQNLYIYDEIDPDTADLLSKQTDGIFDENGRIDIYKASTRAARYRNSVNDTIQQIVENGGDFNTIKSGLREFVQSRQVATDFKASISLDELKRKYFENKDFGKPITDDTHNRENSYLNSKNDTREKDDNKPIPNEPVGDREGIMSYLSAAFKNGGEFVTFRVDHTGSVDESFQSSTGETDLAQKFNSISAQGRAAKFALFNGNIDGGIIDTLTGAVGSMIEGGLSMIPGVGAALLNIFKAGTGSGYIDIPEYWQNSSANMPSMNYTMQLISPYNNPFSQMINIYIPLAMILAGALPLSTGKQSYTSPFLCQVFDRGRCQTRLGMITSLQISRGTSNLGFNRDKQALAIDVSFTVKDLSTVMHMPVESTFSLDPFKGLFDEDTVFTDYMSILASNSLSSNIYIKQKLTKRMVAKYNSSTALISKGYLASFIHEKTPLGYLDLFMREVYRE